MRRAARTDSNQTQIVQALRRAGATVISLADQGSGVPDLLIGFAGKTALMEVKDGSKPPSERTLTPMQLLFHAQWRGGTLAVVNDIEGALRVLKVMES